MGLIACVSKHTSTVLPSGAARATNCVPTWLAAPGRFSTTTGLPMRSESRGWRILAVMSVEPPGGKVTTSLSEASDCANAEGASVPAASAAAMRRASRREKSVMVGAPGSNGCEGCARNSAHPLAHGNSGVLQLLRDDVDERGAVVRERGLD